MYRRRLTAQQKNERRQDNCDKERLACQHPSDLLCLLTPERDRWRTARRCLDSTSSVVILSDQTFHMLRVSHMMRMHIPSKMIMNDNCPQDQDFLFWYQTVVVATVVLLTTLLSLQIYMYMYVQGMYIVYTQRLRHM